VLAHSGPSTSTEPTLPMFAAARKVRSSRDSRVACIPAGKRIPGYGQRARRGPAPRPPCCASLAWRLRRRPGPRLRRRRRAAGRAGRGASAKRVQIERYRRALRGPDGPRRSGRRSVEVASSSSSPAANVGGDVRAPARGRARRRRRGRCYLRTGASWLTKTRGRDGRMSGDVSGRRPTDGCYNADFSVP
jgi:hypothetical protein